MVSGAEGGEVAQRPDGHPPGRGGASGPPAERRAPPRPPPVRRRSSPTEAPPSGTPGRRRAGRPPRRPATPARCSGDPPWPPPTCRSDSDVLPRAAQSRSKPHAPRSISSAVMPPIQPGVDIRSSRRCRSSSRLAWSSSIAWAPRTARSWTRLAGAPGPRTRSARSSASTQLGVPDDADASMLRRHRESVAPRCCSSHGALARGTWPAPNSPEPRAVAQVSPSAGPPSRSARSAQRSARTTRPRTRRGRSTSRWSCQTQTRITSSRARFPSPTASTTYKKFELP